MRNEAAAPFPSSILYLLSSLFVFTGCVDQKKEVALYRGVLDKDVAGPVAPLADGEDLTLVRALLLANQDNESLAIRGEDYVQAMIEKNRAFAGFLPTIGLEPSYSVVDNADAPRQDNGAGRPVGSFGSFKEVGDTLRRFEAPAISRMNLFNGFRDRAAFESAAATIEERRRILLDAQSRLLLDVARAYYNVLRLEASVRVIEKSLEAQMERVREAKGRIDAGVGSSLALAQSEAQAASTRVLLTQAKSDVRNARTLLAFLIGAKSVTGRLFDQYGLPDDIGALEDLIARGIEAREDLAAAIAALGAARWNVENAFGQYYPSVSLNITGFLVRENFETASKWNTLLLINVPIFTAGLIEADVREAWSLLRQAALNESLLRRQIEQEVRFRYEEWQTASIKLKELDATIKAASEAYRQARAGRDAGTAITLDVLSAQQTLLDAELAQASQEYDRKVIYLDLLRTTGRLNLAAAQQAATTRPATQPVNGG